MDFRPPRPVGYPPRSRAWLGWMLVGGLMLVSFALVCKAVTEAR